MADDSTNGTKADKSAAPKSSEPRELTEAEVHFRENDPYVQALRLAVGHLDKKLRAGSEALHAAEVGVYRGRSLAVLLEAGLDTGLPINWHGFDNFEGLPPLSDKDVELAPASAPYLKRPMFADTTEREVLAYLDPIGANDKLELHIGLIEDTLAKQPDREYFFANIAIKTYAAHKVALDYFYSRMTKGGILVFDDYFNRGQFPMAEVAVREFMDDKPEPIYWLFSGEGQSTFRRAFIVKA